VTTWIAPVVVAQPEAKLRGHGIEVAYGGDDMTRPSNGATLDLIAFQTASGDLHDLL
jgi:hypothetical protein